MRLARAETLAVSCLIGVSALTAACALISDRFTPIPSDTEMEMLFKSHRADFEKLVTMSDEDPKVIRIAYDFTWVAGEKQSGEMGRDRPIGFSVERWNEYKKLFTGLNLEGGLTRSENGDLIMLAAYTAGLATSGISKGYMYSRVPVSCEVPSLDDRNAFLDKNFACKTLDANWYLFLD